MTPTLLEEEKVFKDPVHRYIHVRYKTIWDLIDTPEFQRLRRIRQLGTTMFTFHGAEHSRFNHSLGVYEIMRRIVTKLEVLTEEERLLCLCSALLHDVGHGPFSHTFEKVFKTDHEEWTRRIIEGETEIRRVLSEVSADFPKKVSEVIGKTYPNKMIVSLISSQIDADRMDYLLRDAYYTGVNYGNFDIERILRLMRPAEEQIAIKYSGMHAVEDYIVSRYQMYWQVYFHPVTRSAEVILKKLFQRAKLLYDCNYHFRIFPEPLVPFFKDGPAKLRQYLDLDEATVIYYIREWKREEDTILSDLAERFMNRRLFKYIQYQPLDYLMWTDLQGLFEDAGLDPAYYLEFDSPSDLPYDFYRSGEEEEERLPILLLMPDGSLEELSRKSDIVQSISGKRRFDHKLYFPEDRITDEIRKRLGVN
ncbi:HD domain-containing protein [Ammoniphilus resinae]|uniref:HD superfamily phosphohydrolase n=1 Tax=Ammoniphilus resinae TaxID=861532 RepID=A0ABS4GUN4_9BACL|nr:HD domain-containing protein [Ammoniphilus resinae]MBP1933973.1 HD superfamily phosphohydrolase [Ammoniphilus resinae]